MFYADQIPLTFIYGKSRSVNPVGRECWLVQPGDGLHKRKATLHWTTGEQVTLAGVVFPGAGTGITQWEKNHYPPNVRIYWQGNAWVDIVAMDQITDDFLTDVSNIEGGMMYGLDNLGAHHNSDIKAKLVAADVFPAFTPSQCSDVIAPGDYDFPLPACDLGESDDSSNEFE
jgi:hypothetical protein